MFHLISRHLCRHGGAPTADLAELEAGGNGQGRPGSAGPNGSPCGVMSVDVEEWFHILSSSAVPKWQDWSSLESRSDINVNRLLDLLHDHQVRATFFWLGWMAERHKPLLQRCAEAGHEIASHGYHHVLPCEAGPAGFREDIKRAREVLEDATGRPIQGFRTAGFGVQGENEWAFEVIKEAGYEYDSSVFPAYHRRGCLHHWQTKPYWIPTQAGRLLEIPLSALDVLGYKLCLFGGGYLRLAPQWMMRWGVRRLHKAGTPLIAYIHPREVDPDQPRLPLSALRRFRCYVNLGTTVPKLTWLCKNCTFVPMREMAGELLSSCPAVQEAHPPMADANPLYRPQSQTI